MLAVRHDALQAPERPCHQVVTQPPVQHLPGQAPQKRKARPPCWAQHQAAQLRALLTL